MNELNLELIKLSERIIDEGYNPDQTKMFDGMVLTKTPQSIIYVYLELLELYKKCTDISKLNITQYDLDC